MDRKTCGIRIITIDDKEIIVKCTPEHFEKIKIDLEKMRFVTQNDNQEDGVIRLWKLGKSDRGILPTQKAVDKLIKILRDDIAEDGVLDLIWDDMIDLQVEHPPQISKLIFLGENLAIRIDSIKNIFVYENSSIPFHDRETAIETNI